MSKRSLYSQIQMLDGEFQRFKRILLEVESYFKEGRSTMDYIFKLKALQNMAY